MSPPTSSISLEISKAFLFLVPLNAICSSICAIPNCLLFSFTLPTFNHKPIDNVLELK